MRIDQKWYGCLCFSLLVTAVAVLPVQKTRGANWSSAGPIVEVKIDNFSFSPSTLTVAAGTTIKWTNRDDIPHTVVSEDKSTFKSKVLDSDDSFSFTFTRPGSYGYFCSLHPKMTAKVIVQ